MSSSPSKDKYRALLSTASKTAGSDSWKTSAGRVDGPDGFVLGDAWKLVKIHFKSTSKPTVCPVCMVTPSSDEEWHITKSCKHAVCRSCLQNYAMSLISDPNHSGPLKCPCCPRVLRVEDAKIALDNRLGVTEAATLSKKKVIQKAVRKRVSFKHHEKGGLFADPDINGERIDHSALEVLEKWDNKKRDELLRSMPSFRPCPHCSGSNGTDAGDSLQNTGSMENKELPNKGGGGFVTPDCLQPINEERESNAERVLNLTGNPSANAVLLTYAIYYLYCGCKKSNSSSPILQIISALLPSVLLPVLPHALRLLLATMARRAVMQPIIVTCPCCFKDFNLNASSEFHLPDSSSDTAAEAATQHWKTTNTRPCPGCAIPIMKDGGCNHVKCGKCRVDFCWACMRPRTNCRAYQCKNGAPFGNVIGDGPLAAREGQGMTLMERIDNVEAAARRNLRQFGMFPFYYAALVCTVCIVISSYAVQRILPLVANFVVSNMHVLFPLVIYLLGYYFTREWRRNNASGDNIFVAFGADGRGRRQDRRQQSQNVLRGFLWPENDRRMRRTLSLQRPRLATEEDQLAEAIARSLVEQ